MPDRKKAGRKPGKKKRSKAVSELRSSLREAVRSAIDDSWEYVEGCIRDEVAIELDPTIPAVVRVCGVTDYHMVPKNLENLVSEFIKGSCLDTEDWIQTLEESAEIFSAQATRLREQAEKVRRSQSHA